VCLARVLVLLVVKDTTSAARLWLDRLARPTDLGEYDSRASLKLLLLGDATFR
jgi:hypothetical protein